MSYAALGQVDTSDLAVWRRYFGISREAGIPAPMVKAIMGHESGGNPAAIRFEPHVFWREKKRLGRVSGSAIRSALTPQELATVPYTPGNTAWRVAHGVAPCCTPPGCTRDRAASCTSSETNRAAFDRAFALDPAQAVKATSWGRGQVLGAKLLAMFNGDPRQAVNGFFADPMAVGDRAFVAWWRTARSDAIAAANSSPPNFNLVAQRYNGCSNPQCAGYEQSLRQRHAEAFSTWNSVRAAVEAAGALVTSTATSVSPLTPALLGVVALGASGAFAWWAYKRRGVRKNSRR
jgi:hypothetical protein